jgi:hypothetical protein
MSDTPRTDEREYERECNAGNSIEMVVTADFARQLERQLNEANTQIVEGIVSRCICKNAESPQPDCLCVHCSIRRAEKERDKLRAEVESLRATVKALQKALQAIGNKYRAGFDDNLDSQVLKALTDAAAAYAVADAMIAERSKQE